ncbi:hypothetical protein BASP5262_15695 [Bacillus spizizenii]|nr:hypothetical protein DJ97_2656 [Bacillus spizizenii]SPU05496.1 Uncharacterised protein [Bacillus spizizenii]
MSYMMHDVCYYKERLSLTYTEQRHTMRGYLL